MDATVLLLGKEDRERIVRETFEAHPYLRDYEPPDGIRCLHCERIDIEERYGVEAKKAWIKLRTLGER